MFSSPCKTALEKNIFSKKSKISVFFYKIVFHKNWILEGNKQSIVKFVLKLKSIEHFLQNNANQDTFGQKLTELG